MCYFLEMSKTMDVNMENIDNLSKQKTSKNRAVAVPQYEEYTNGFRVIAEPRFFTEQMEEDCRYYIYTYRITIENHSPENAQLLRRYWYIRDGAGEEDYVFGEGVVGKQPIISQGESYSYISGCPLVTPTGNMRGHYHMASDSGKRFDIKIPLFFLRPDLVNLH